MLHGTAPLITLIFSRRRKREEEWRSEAVNGVKWAWWWWWWWSRGKVGDEETSETREGGMKRGGGGHGGLWQSGEFPVENVKRRKQ